MSSLIALLVAVTIVYLARRSATSTISFSPMFWVWAGKCGQLGLLLLAFEEIDGFGKILLIPAFVLHFAPSWFLGELLVPLGWPRLTYWAARCFGPVRLVKEGGAGAALFGALALTRKRNAATGVSWLAQRANRSRSIRGAGVVTAGVLAALRGERDRARSLFLLADTLPAKLVSGNVRVIARDWLVAEAAQNGNWREVVRLGRRGRQSFRWSYAVARMGARLIGDPKSARDWLLWLCWLAAPRRRATFPLLRRALTAKPPSWPALPEPAMAPELPEALGSFAQGLAGRFAQDGRSLVRAVGAVEGALALPSTRALIGERLPALGAKPDADAVIDGFRRRLIDLIDPLIEETPDLAQGEDLGSLLDEAVSRIRSRLFRHIDAQCKDCNERQKQELSLETLTEWEAWAVIREAADRLLELAPSSEIALFQTMYVPMCNYAVFQHNICKRIALAHEIFAWLRRHSDSDASACELLSKNMRASQGGA
jgi:hypothetical protein